MRIACGIVGLLFLVSATLQWNDPDPWAWMAVYASGAVVSLWAWRRPVPRAVPFVVAAVAFGWALALAPSALAGFRFSDLAREMQAATPEIERSRELLGLLVVAGWSIAVGLLRGAQRKTARDAPGRP